MRLTALGRSGALLVGLAVTTDGQSTTPVRQQFQAAVAAQQRGDLKSAVAGYQQVLKLDPAFAAARASLAAALLTLGRTDESIANYQVALRASPYDPALRRGLAFALYKKGDISTAALELQALHREAPNDLAVTKMLGDCLLQTGHYKDLIEVLTPVQKAHAGDVDLAFLLGSALIHEDRPKEGLPLIERAAIGGRNADAWMLAGLTQLQLSEYAAARKSLDEALRINPSLPGLYTLSGMAKSMTNDEEGAKAAYRKAVQADPNDLVANLRLGSLLYRQRDLAGAKQYLGRALRIDPRSVPGRYAMALVKTAEGQDQEAAADLAALVREAPNLLPAHVKLAALYYKLQRPDDGMRERQMVDQLLARTEQQDQQLDADPSLRIEVPTSASGARAPSP